MYVSKVQLKNIRGIGPKGLTFDFAKSAVAARGTMAGWNVIAGPNGAGKTTLLQGLAASLVGGSGANWLLRPDDRLEWIHRLRGDGLPTDVGATCTWVERTAGDPIAPRERSFDPTPLLVDWPRDPSSSFNRPPSADHSFVLRHFWDASTYGVKPAGWLFAGYGPNRGNPRSSPDAAQLFRAAPRTAAMVTLFREDAGLEAANVWLAELEFKARGTGGQHEEVLRDGILRFLGDGLLVEGAQTPLRVEAEGLQVRWQGGWRPLRVMGDGHRAVLSLVLDLILRISQFCLDELFSQILVWGETKLGLAIDVAGTVVIDEPEVHLHPALQRRLGFWLKAHFPQIQFIVTTHSPLICQAADQGGLFRMESGKKFSAVDKETWTSVAGGTIDDAVLTDLFGLEHAESDEAAETRRRFAELEVRKLKHGLSGPEHDERIKLANRLPTDPTYQLDTLVQALLKE